MADLDDAVAVVTGASSGIGAATVRALAGEGADVVLAARREERLAEIADEVASAHGVATTVAPTDVTDEEACEALIETAIDEYGRLDVVVNNAGLGLGSDVASLSSEDYRTMMGVNVDGVFYTTRAALQHLADDGHLIFVGSVAGQYPRPSNPAYAASKWWVRGFAKSVSAQYGDTGLAVTVVNPSEVRTGFGSQDGDPFRDRFEPGTASEPEDVAEAIVYAAGAGHTVPLEIDLYRRDKVADMF